MASNDWSAIRKVKSELLKVIFQSSLTKGNQPVKYIPPLLKPVSSSCSHPPVQDILLHYAKPRNFAPGLENLNQNCDKETLTQINILKIVSFQQYMYYVCVDF